MDIRFRKAAVLVAVISLTISQTRVRAQAKPVPFLQDLPQQFRNDPYVANFAAVLDAWNSGTLELPSKGDLRPTFQQRLVQTVQLKIYPYEDTAWQDLMLKNFDQLPATVKPEKTLTSEGGQILIVLFLKDLDQFKQEVKLSEAKDALSLPLFIILGSAQEATIAKKLGAINSTRILESVLAWWTTTWPFCRRSKA